MSKKIKIVFIIIISVLLLSLFNMKVLAEEEKFALDEQSVNVFLNGTTTLYYSGSSGTATWHSNDTSIATVEDGTVEGKKIGTTTITATIGTETETWTVNVIYRNLAISSNEGKTSKINLILGEHPFENLTAIVEDDDFKQVSNPFVTWASGDSSVVSVDSSTGTITALKTGKTTITAIAAGVKDTREVNVFASPTFIDFSNAKYETTINTNEEILNITGITPNTDNTYYYIITSTNAEPELATTKTNRIDTENCKDTIEYLSVNSEKNSIYPINISKYAELNQDMYIYG